MRDAARRWLWILLLCIPGLGCAQSATGKPAGPSASPADVVGSASSLEHAFFDIIRSGDALRLLSYVPQDGVNIGRNAQHSTRDEIADQLTQRTGLYCKLFDSACLHPNAADPQTQKCSYRELLTQSDKVRTASTETTRNGVRQAILVAEVRNEKCGGPVLIDFIFNHQEGGWKLFSIP